MTLVVGGAGTGIAAGSPTRHVHFRERAGAGVTAPSRNTHAPFETVDEADLEHSVAPSWRSSSKVLLSNGNRDIVRHKPTISRWNADRTN